MRTVYWIIVCPGAGTGLGWYWYVCSLGEAKMDYLDIAVSSLNTDTGIQVTFKATCKSFNKLESIHRYPHSAPPYLLHPHRHTIMSAHCSGSAHRLETCPALLPIRATKMKGKKTRPLCDGILPTCTPLTAAVIIAAIVSATSQSSWRAAWYFGPRVQQSWWPATSTRSEDRPLWFRILDRCSHHLCA